VIGRSHGCNTPPVRWVPSPWSPVPSQYAWRDFGTDSIPTGYKLMRRVPHSEEGLRLGYQLTKRNPHFNGERGSTATQNAVYICGVMARGHHCGLARAFAVNPSRLPARPSGLRGLTAQRGQARGLPCHQCRTALARALVKRKEKRKNVDHEKPLDSRRLI